MNKHIAQPQFKFSSAFQSKIYIYTKYFPFVFKFLYGYSRKLFFQLESAFKFSDSNISFGKFIHEMNKLKILNQSDYFDFDEDFYLLCHNDVAVKVTSYNVFSGYVHYLLHGRSEGRIYSDSYLNKCYSITPSASKISEHALQGLISAVTKTKPFEDTIQIDSSLNSKRCLYAYYPHLQNDLFYAGYTSYSKYLRSLSSHYDHVTILVTETLVDNMDCSLLANFFESFNVIHVSSHSDHKLPPPSIVFTFDAKTTFSAYEFHFASYRNRIIYFCQDYEAGFYAYGDQYIACLKVLTLPIKYVISTPVLLSHLQRYTGADPFKVHTIAPKIAKLNISLKRSRKILFYYRPEKHNLRNLPSNITNAVKKLSTTLSGYEFILIGTVGISFSMNLLNNRLSVVSKLSGDDYLALLRDVDLVVSLIYNYHPGVIAYQSAISGIPTITNLFANRGYDYYSSISENIIPYDVCYDDLADLIIDGLACDKAPSRPFNLLPYSGTDNRTAEDFVFTNS